AYGREARPIHARLRAQRIECRTRPRAPLGPILVKRLNEGSELRHVVVHGAFAVDIRSERHVAELRQTIGAFLGVIAEPKGFGKDDNARPPSGPAVCAGEIADELGFSVAVFEVLHVEALIKLRSRSDTGCAARASRG